MILTRPLPRSILIHLSVVGLFFLGSWLNSISWKPKPIDFEVIQYPAPANPALKIEPPKVEEKLKPPPQKSVFGVSRKAITADASVADAATIKEGNTVAKEQDNLKLEKDDPDSLPIPTDSYLVSSMPKLKSEIRIPYPPEAKKAGIEGAVVMDLLIDSSGKVRSVTLIKGPGFGLNEAALSAIEKFEFLPAKMGEQAVAVKIRYSYRFVLENR